MLTNYWPSLAGGVLIGLSSAMLLVLNGRVAGISGIVGHLLGRWSGEAAWRVAFLLGLVGGPLVFLAIAGHAPEVHILATTRC